MVADLADLDTPVEDQILILNILWGLNQRFEHVGSIIRRYLGLFPSWTLLGRRTSHSYIPVRQSSHNGDSGCVSSSCPVWFCALLRASACLWLYVLR
jgi:hypothetical protein